MAESPDLPVLVEGVAAHFHLPHDFHFLEVREALLTSGGSFGGDAILLAVQLEGLVGALRLSMVVPA